MPRPIVAIVGRPNVGKSTLFNRLLRRKQAIVGDLPGITRDRNHAMAEYNDRKFLLVDTGGFVTNPREPLMQQMLAQVRMAVEEADCILFVMDGRAGLTPMDREVNDFLRTQHKTVHHVINKVDGEKLENEALVFYELGMERIFTISAEHDLGIHELMEEVVQSFPPDVLPPEQGPLRISVIGKPNVGKSTLINSLIGEERLIASNIPGTTRDTIDTLFTFNRNSYVLVDTAGMRRKSKITHQLEAYSVFLVMKSIENSDLCLILIDAVEGITEQDAKIAGLVHDAGVASILLVNKWDLAKKDKNRKSILDDIRTQLKFMDYAPILFVSALTGETLDSLFPLIDELKQVYYKRVSTAEVNKTLQDAITRHEPPLHKKRRIKFFYGTQTDIAPPTFVLFANMPASTHFSYRRYLTNQFRKNLGFTHVPIRIFYKKRK
jgi:GTP-binding protein